jgi:magnesium transporter
MQIKQVTELNNFLDQHRPAWSSVRWIQVEGLNQMQMIRAFAEKYQLHPLAIEDMLIASNQPKLEDYPGSDEMPGRLFIVGRMVKMDGDALSSEQVSLFLGRSTLLSFQDSINPVFESIYHRIEIPGSRLRTHDVSFLLHALMDAIVDSYFPALESYGECLEELDDELRARPAPNTLQRIHEVKRNLVLLRRSIWPMRELWLPICSGTSMSACPRPHRPISGTSTTIAHRSSICWRLIAKLPQLSQKPTWQWCRIA